MNSKEIGRKRQQAVRGISLYFSEGTEEIHENTCVKTIGVPAWIQTKHFPNKSIERYSCSNLLGLSVRK
jgi:hypothetical protein